MPMNGIVSASPRASEGVYVRFGSEADMTALNRDVRFTPKSGHRESQLSGDNRGHTRIMDRLAPLGYLSALKLGKVP